jgi:DNA-binding NtrC family response regulator
MPDKRIIIVDNEPEMLELLGDALAARGCRVNRASTAEGALELLWANAYDVAIVNDNLPGVDAVDLFVQIRSVDPRLARRTLFLSRKDPFPAVSQRPRVAATEGPWLPDSSDIDKLLRALDDLLPDDRS